VSVCVAKVIDVKSAISEQLICGIAVALGGTSHTSSVSLSNSLLSLNVAQGGRGGSGADGGNGSGGAMFVGADGSASLDQTNVLLDLAIAGLAGAGGTNGSGIGGGLYGTSGGVGVVTLHKSTVALNFASTSNYLVFSGSYRKAAQDGDDGEAVLTLNTHLW
jgi:hypothetical protein